MIFKKGRGTKKKEEWKWGDEGIEETKDFKYLIQISRLPLSEKRGYRETHRGYGKENDNSIKANLGNRSKEVQE